MELDLQSLLGLLCTAVLLGRDPRNSPFPPHLCSYMRALLVSQDRRHLFVTLRSRSTLGTGLDNGLKLFQVAVTEAEKKQFSLTAVGTEYRQSTRLILQSSELGPPHPQASVSPPPLVTGGGTHMLAGEGGGGGVPIPTREGTLWYSKYICTLWRGHSWGGQPSCRIGRSATGLSTYSPSSTQSHPCGSTRGGGHVADRKSAKD
jgi:hypothetical protein